MASAQLYSIAAYPASSTWVNIGNIPGSDASEGTNTLTAAIGSGVQLQLAFNTSSIPAGAIVTAVSVTVMARCNASSSRTFYSAECEQAYGSTYTVAETAAFTTTAALYTINLQNPGNITEHIGNTDLRMNLVFLSKIASSRVTYVQYAYITITYTEATGNKGVLFMGENF